MNTFYPIKCYKIWWEDKPELGVYVGSTKQKMLSQRMVEHRRSANQNQSGKIYDTIRTHGGQFNYVILCEYAVENWEQQRMYEQKWMDELKPTLNMIRSYKTAEDHKEEQHRYYIKNQDKLIEEARVYREKNATYLKEQRRIKYNSSKYKAYIQQRQQRAREEGTYRCEPCNYNFGRNAELQNHLLTLKHQRNTTL